MSYNKTFGEPLESSDYYIRLFDQLPSLMRRSGLDAQCDWFNSKWLEFTGRKLEEEIGNGWAEGVHPDDFNRCLKIYLDNFNARLPFEMDYRLKHFSGQYRWIRDIGQPFNDEKGNFAGFLGTCYDIHEGKEAELSIKKLNADLEEKVARRTEELQTLADNISQLVWMADEGGYTFWYNKRWYDYTGTTFRDMEGWGWQKAIHPDFYQKVITKFKNTIRSQQVWEDTFPIKGKDGEYYWFLSSAIPIKDKNGKVVRWFGSNTDITHHIKIEEKLERNIQELSKTNTDLDNFIYTASHDLKAPISNIEGLVSSLSEIINDISINKEEFNNIMDMINKSIDRFKLTIQDLTDITKAQKDISDDESDIIIAEIVNDVKVSLLQEIKDTNAIINLHFHKFPKIQYSKTDFRSIIFNLLGNAIKYRDPKRTPVINVGCTSEEDYIILSIEDNGLGIDPHKINQVFTMFKRLHNHVEGTGIGLYIVKRIIENKGGKIEVESQLGKGTIFKVYFKAVKKIQYRMS